MFQIGKGHILASIMLLGGSSQPIISHASEAKPAKVTAVEPSPRVESQRATGFSADQFRNVSQAKLSNAQHWIKEKTFRHDAENPLKTLDVKIDRFQDEVSPIGRSIKSFAGKKARGAGILRKGDQMFTMFGFLLFGAFGFVCALMALSGPTSRLGGRH